MKLLFHRAVLFMYVFVSASTPANLSLTSAAPNSSQPQRHAQCEVIPEKNLNARSASGHNANAERNRGRRIVVVRHGERIDSVFGSDWIHKSFDSEGNYRKGNLNMPDSLLKRKGTPLSYAKDTPLTQFGLLQGQLLGQGLREQNIFRPGFQIYVSPALRCIQTAAQILKGYKLNNAGASARGRGESPLLLIDYALVEWLGYDVYQTGFPTYMTPDELTAAGFKVDAGYRPFMTIQGLDIHRNETRAGLYNRTFAFVRHLLQMPPAAGYDTQGGDILLVAHGGTLDAATHHLLGRPPRTLEEMEELTHGISFVGVAIVEEVREQGQVQGQGQGQGWASRWVYKEAGAIQMQNSATKPFRADQHFCR